MGEVGLNGVLYFEDQRIDGIKEVEMETPDVPARDNRQSILGIDLANGHDFSAEFSMRLPRNNILSLVYGHRITNNWLKVHGGIMERKAWRRKRHVRS